VTAGASTVNTPARSLRNDLAHLGPAVAAGVEALRIVPLRKYRDAPNAASRLPHYVDAAADDRPPGRFSPVVPTRRVRTIG
jgi:hypothetical protein